MAAASGVATAHGLYQVAAASRVPTPVAWLYPVITDGLALVAYAAMMRLADGGRRYAATIVILAAGLSGIAQAVYLAGGIDTRAVAPVGLRFGVGAWPAAAAALTAHLLHLIGTDPASAETPAAVSATCQSTPSPNAFNHAAVQPYNPPSGQPSNLGTEHPAVQPARTTTPAGEAAQPDRSTTPEQDEAPRAKPGQPGSADGGAPARDRAQQAARSHYTRHGALPTVTELMELAQVARGTAGTVLKDLRDNRRALYLVNADTSKESE